LKSAEKLTYRVDISMDKVVLYAKNAEESDNEYALIGEAASKTVSKTKWSVNFTSEATTDISEIGIYSGLSGVRYDIGGFKEADYVYYSAEGEKGHTMTDLLNPENNVVSGNVTVNDKGELVLAKRSIVNADGTTTVEGNAVLSLHKLLSGGIERCELDLTVNIEDGGRMLLYFLDNSGFRYTTSSFTPSSFNNKSTGYVWKAGQYYDIKLITNVVGYDEDGQARTSASMYAREKGAEEWICVAQNQLLTAGQVVGTNSIQVTFLNAMADKTVTIENISIKTYEKEKGDYSFINSIANMPTVDYIYSFDYLRMDDEPAEFTIGGEDYSQTFNLSYYKTYSDATHHVSADVDIEKNKWYRFFGKVTMTDEYVYANDRLKILKNKISLYMTDENGNTTTLFEDLPMLKGEGKNGIRFGLTDTVDGGIKIKNVRAYNGKVVDFVSVLAEGKSADLVVDFLNDDVAVNEDFTAIAGVYNNGVQSGVASQNVVDDIVGYGNKRISFNDVECENIGENPNYKVFVWQNLENLIPLINYADNNSR